uniref:Putative RING finger and CHY zinc finger domain-containing protein 1 n=1 Tax=Davidia involucrata TaxID=16924 RepID=A0A5B6YXG8_DAVIN
MVVMWKHSRQVYLTFFVISCLLSGRKYCFFHNQSWPYLLITCYMLKEFQRIAILLLESNGKAVLRKGVSWKLSDVWGWICDLFAFSLSIKRKVAYPVTRLLVVVK